MKEVDRAYLAGLFDGEGCVCPYYARYKNGSCVVQRITITNTDKELLQSLQCELGFGKLRLRTKQEGRKESWSLEFCASREVKAFIDCVMPYARLKKLHLMLSLQMVETTKYGRGRGQRVSDEERKTRELCMGLLKELNRRGDSKQLGEFSEMLNLLRSKHANTEPSSLNGIEVEEKVQRLMGEEPTNNPDMSAQPEREDIVRA